MSAALPLALAPSVEQVLGAYEERQRREDELTATLSPDEFGRRRDELLISVGRATGVLLNVLVRSARARRILELGTAFGYSTVWLADAARHTGGRVHTVDISAPKQQYARRQLEAAGLDDIVDFSCGEAVSVLAGCVDAYDFVLVDVWKDQYIACFESVRAQLAPGAIVVADNMISPPHVRLAATRYLAHVRAVTGRSTVVLPVGGGIAVTRDDCAQLPLA